jgi:hypothetical protein
MRFETDEAEVDEVIMANAEKAGNGAFKARRARRALV